MASIRDLTRAIDTAEELEWLWNLTRDIEDASGAVPGWLADAAGLPELIHRLRHAHEAAERRLEREGKS